MADLATGKYRRGTSYEVTLPTLPSLTIQPRRVEIHQKPYHHDILLMEFSQISPMWFDSVKTGVPIKFSWKQGSNTNSWIGYVSFITKSVSGQIENLMEVHCVGATFVLKERVTKTFSNTTISEAVRTIVTEFGFNFVGEDSGTVFEQLTIAGHSYWEWIVEQAKRLGYGIYVDNMNFYFRPLDKLVEQSITSVPVLGFEGVSGGINNQFLDRTLDWFKVLNGEHIETPGSLRTNKVVGGVDPVTAQVFSKSKSPKEVGNNFRGDVNDVLFSEVKSEHVVHAEQVAETLSEGSAQLARLNMPAAIKCQGDPRIHPFGVVQVQNTGASTDGFWISSDVKHLFARLGDYQIEMHAMIDGTGMDTRTSTKDGTKDPVGVVNLTEALNTDSYLKPSDSVKLSLKTPVFTEAAQGFNRTPSRWVYVG